MALHIVYVSKFLKIFKLSNYNCSFSMFNCFYIFGGTSFFHLSLFAQTFIIRGYRVNLRWCTFSGIAFLLQIIALQHLFPCACGYNFFSEGVFASIAAWILLDQYLNEFKNTWNFDNFYLQLFSLNLRQFMVKSYEN